MWFFYECLKYYEQSMGETRVLKRIETTKIVNQKDSWKSLDTMKKEGHEEFNTYKAH